MGNCEREAILKLLVRLRREIQGLDIDERAKKKVLEKLRVYELELEDLLASEPVFSRT